MDGIKHIWQFRHGYFKSVETDGAAPEAATSKCAKQAAQLAAVIRAALEMGLREGSLVADTAEPVASGMESERDLYAVGGEQCHYEVVLPLADAEDGPKLERSLWLLLRQDRSGGRMQVPRETPPAVVVGWWVDGTRLIADCAFLVEGSHAAFTLANELGYPCVYSFARDKAQSAETLTGNGRTEWQENVWGAYNMFRRATSPANSLPGMGEPVDTGLYELDRALGGLRPGSLTIVAGRRGAGKTSLALTLAANAAKQDATVLFFSLGLSADEAARCLLCGEALVSVEGAQRGTLTDGECYVLNKVTQRFTRSKLARARC